MLLLFVAVFIIIITTASFEDLETFAASLGGRSINRRGLKWEGLDLKDKTPGLSNREHCLLLVQLYSYLSLFSLRG